MKKLLQKISKEAILNNPDFFTDQEKSSNWIGRSPASDEAIVATEKRLGIKLPKDVIDFYKISNGSSVILNQCFGAFMPIEEVNWLKNVDADLVESFTGITEELTEGLSNSIIIAGHNYCHNILIIPPLGKHKKWRYWEFASYVPGETPFAGMKKYLERLDDFITDQNKNKAETENK